jgi:hypothetical protein
MTSAETPPPPSRAAFYPDEIVLYGVRLNDAQTSDLRFALGDKQFRLRLGLQADDGTAVGPEAHAIAVTYGYAYEGHCYRLDRPKILVLVGVSDAPAAGCGFDAAGESDDHYRMWRIRASTELFELGGMAGRAEDLILQANTPGRQAPNTYAVNMQLAQRGPRMPRSGGS